MKIQTKAETILDTQGRLDGDRWYSNERQMYHNKRGIAETNTENKVHTNHMAVEKRYCKKLFFMSLLSVDAGQ